MSHRFALVLFLVIVAASLLDHFANNGIATLFLARKLVGMIEWVAFWR